MRVLHLISSGGMYGAEAVILQLTQGMRDHGDAVGVVCPFAHAGVASPQLLHAAVDLGVEAEVLACRGQLDTKFPAALRALVTRLHIDVLHAHGYKADIYAYLAYRSGTRPALVSTCHTWYDNDLAVKLYGAADRWVLRHFDEVVAVSNEVRERLRKAGVADSRLHLIQNGVTVPEQISQARVRSGQAGAPQLRVGLVGRLAPEKGVDVFLQAAAKLQREFPTAEFVIAGDGPQRSALEHSLPGLGIVDRVTFLGRQEDMSAFYASLDVLVSTSRQEGLPVALLEGMAAGLPVVATSVGEVPQVVADGQTGFLVGPDAPEKTAEAVGRLLEDSALRSRFGTAARERIQSRFSAERMTEEYLAVYRLAMRRQGDVAAERSHRVRSVEQR